MKKSTCLCFLGTLIILLNLFIQPLPALAGSSVLSTSRLAGTDRIGTAIAVAQQGWSSASTVMLAGYNAYPDAIAATPLAVKLHAPVLLTEGNTLEPRVAAELTRLQPQQVILLGGTGILPLQVEQDLTDLGISWRRIGGVDRYQTSALLAAEMDSDEVIVANGDNFPDALSAASFAGIRQIPILLTSAGYLPPSVANYFREQDPGHVLVVGGESVVPSGILSNHAIAIETRLGGIDRYETNAKVYAYTKDSYTSSDVYLASGEQFPDALVGTALAAKSGAPLLLTTFASLPEATQDIIQDISSIDTVYLLGGMSVVSGRIQALLEGKDPTPYLLLGRTLVIDAGHGAPDPGAIGPAGTLEKDINLAIALKLAEGLKQLGANVILTRDDNEAPTYPDYQKTNDLESRADLANKNNASLFVSIHSNSSLSANPTGSSTYFSQDNPQSYASLILAQYVQNALVQSLGTINHGVKEAQFYVIHHTTMPAVLVEVAYISNPQEEQKLKDPAFQQKAADGISQGIRAYYYGFN